MNEAVFMINAWQQGVDGLTSFAKVRQAVKTRVRDDSGRDRSLLGRFIANMHRNIATNAGAIDVYACQTDAEAKYFQVAAATRAHLNL